MLKNQQNCPIWSLKYEIKFLKIAVSKTKKKFGEMMWFEKFDFTRKIFLFLKQTETLNVGEKIVKYFEF